MQGQDRSSEAPPFRCGYVGLIGRPNVGKSTLLNALIEHRLSIVSDKPQTTRHRVLGVRNRPGAQIVYVDTPGIHRNEHRRLNRWLNRAAGSVLHDMDVLVVVVEALRWRDDDDLVLEQLQSVTCPLLAVVNKVDRVADKAQLLPFLAALAGRADFAGIVPLSARAGPGDSARADLEDALVARLPEAATGYFPPEQRTDRPEGFLVTERVREQLMRSLGQELPYATTVSLERDWRRRGLRHLNVVIWVEREGQKAIVIGEGGRQLKTIGERARTGIEGLLGERVHLDLWVKVRRGWSDDDAALRRFGYAED